MSCPAKPHGNARLGTSERACDAASKTASLRDALHWGSPSGRVDDSWVYVGDIDSSSGKPSLLQVWHGPRTFGDCVRVSTHQETSVWQISGARLSGTLLKRTCWTCSVCFLLLRQLARPTVHCDMATKQRRFFDESDEVRAFRAVPQVHHAGNFLYLRLVRFVHCMVPSWNLERLITPLAFPAAVTLRRGVLHTLATAVLGHLRVCCAARRVGRQPGGAGHGHVLPEGIRGGGA